MSAQRTRVAMLITELDVGGAEKRFCDIACGLDRQRFDVSVCALGPPPENDTLVRRLAEADIQPRFLGCQSGQRFLVAKRGVSQWLQETQADVLQTFLFHANVLGALAAPRSLPLSLGLRVADPRRWRSWVERAAASRAARVVCVSQSVARFAAKRGFPETKLLVIPNGVEPVDAQPLDPETLGVPNNAPRIVFAGRLDPQKGWDWLAPLTEEWLTGSPPNTRLLLAGDGPQREWIELTLSRQHVADRVHLLGFRSDLPALLAAADLVVLPSRWEGMPNVLLEAMAAGRAVLCSEAEGVGEVLGTGPEARRQQAPFGDLATWRQRTGELLRDPDERTRLGRYNAERISQHFTRRRMVERFEAVLSELASSR